MYQKIKQFFTVFFSSLGVLLLLFFPLNYFLPEKITIEWLQAVSCELFIIVLYATLIFKKGISYRNLWIKRSILCIISTFTIVFINYLFGWIHVEAMIEFSIKTLLLVAVISIIAYLIADKVEKKYLQKINEKLKKMNIE